MKNKIKNSLKKLLFKQELKQLEEQEKQLALIASSIIKSRALSKALHKAPIRVLFVCHEPSLWSMFESIYQTMNHDQEFDPIVIALPYSHPSTHKNQYKDAGVLELLEKKDIKVISAYDNSHDKWLDPVDLLPDYVFFQTPYKLFPDKWSAIQISSITKICYVPYATSLFRGGVDDTLHPENFFKYTNIVFKENSFSKDAFMRKFENKDWYNAEKTVISGHPKLDYLSDNVPTTNAAWKRSGKNDTTRILWTPRWNTSDNCCHFFDYKNFFPKFCSQHAEIDLTLRPHPLCFDNFITTGELSEDDLSSMTHQYEHSPNQLIDQSADYQGTFSTCDILVSDVSSMMLEFFATGKPIIYTHSQNTFNAFGEALSQGFYWVENEQELEQQLEQLIQGNDPLRNKRQEILASQVYLPEGGAGNQIKQCLRSDFFSVIE